jgi:hypothetical protein
VTLFKNWADSLWIVFQDSKNNYWFGSNGEVYTVLTGKPLFNTPHFTVYAAIVYGKSRKTNLATFTSIPGRDQQIRRTNITSLIQTNSQLLIAVQLTLMIYVHWSQELRRGVSLDE